ncbi:hypothetical protein [Humidesulfovibrio idahonensis]
MVNPSPTRRILLTLSHGVVVPALSRHTGAPCRAVQTRWLVVEMNKTLRLMGCLDRKGRVFRTSVRDSVPLQALIRALWDKAPFRRDFLVVIDLAQVARTTQNVKAKLTELLLKFGALQAPPPSVPSAPAP